MAEEVRSTQMRRGGSRDAASQPRVAAQGADPVGEEILRLARRHDIPLRQDPALAAALSQLDPGVSVPPELFRAVAEVLAFVHRVNGK